ncbi:MAG: nucleoside triphosphate pyrophosphohydrolase [Tepidiformaceae bacterium]
MTIHIAGLGPGRPSLLTEETRVLLESGIPVLLRTRHHPAVAHIDASGRFSDCDDVYRASASFDEVYEGIASRVLALARAGDVAYVVPGHPLVAERSVTLLLEQAKAAAIATRVYPALSFADLAGPALGLDMGNMQLCDALDFRIDARRPALVSQVFDRDVSAALKGALLEMYPANHPVTVLTALGSGDESLRTLPVAEMDHRAFGYLDCLYIPALAAEEDVRRLDGLQTVVARLHAPGGCPWDREQTHASLRPHLLEEAYEALDAIDSGDPARIAEELGDVLLQVLMHAEVGARSGEFTLADVTSQITTKLIRRHPHVFAGADAGTAAEVHRNWDAIKQAEKPHESILDGLPATLPALAASQSIQGRARRTGFDWPDIDGPLEKLVEEVSEFARATAGDGDREDEFGDILFVAANIAQRLGIDAEQALRGANEKFRRRFGAMEAIALAEGIALKDLDLAALDVLWERAKRQIDDPRLTIDDSRLPRGAL